MNIFKELINAWRGNAFTVATLNDFSRMANETKKMYSMVVCYIFKHKKVPYLEKKLYAEDIFVNKSERKIRKRLVEHLAVTQNVDIGMTLVMMSIIKDAERIGDYCKNMFQGYNQLNGKFSKKNKYYKSMKDIGLKLEPLFDKTIRSFKKNDSDQAQSVIEKGFRLEKDCDELIASITKSKLSANEAVVCAMLARFMKRITAHLCNIASSVIYPVHKIDFFPKYLKEDRKAKKK